MDRHSIIYVWITRALVTPRAPLQNQKQMRRYRGKYFIILLLYLCQLLPLHCTLGTLTTSLSGLKNLLRRQSRMPYTPHQTPLNFFRWVRSLKCWG